MEIHTDMAGDLARIIEGAELAQISHGLPPDYLTQTQVMLKKHPQGQASIEVCMPVRGVWAGCGKNHEIVRDTIRALYCIGYDLGQLELKRQIDTRAGRIERLVHTMAAELFPGGDPKAGDIDKLLEFYEL
jgi:hypothetical protein